METYLSKKYSGLLDIEDIENLFENLKQAYGSIRKTANKCGIARSTAYGWKEAKYVKSITKTKILKASMDDDLTETLGFLSNKSKERTSDLLLTYLSSIYQKAIREDREIFPNLLLKFSNARREHFGLIKDTLQDEVNKMMSVLAERATEFQIPLPRDSLDMVESSYLLELLPDLVHDIFIERADLRETANRYNVPLEYPMTLQNAWEVVVSRFTTTFAQQRARMQEWLQLKKISPKSPEFVDTETKTFARANTTRANTWIPLQPEG